MATGMLVFGILMLCLSRCRGASIDGDNHLGVNYGTLSNDLPGPNDVAVFLRSTSSMRLLGKIKLFGADTSILTALANTGIDVIVGVSNEEVLEMGARGESAKGVALQWVQSNVATYLPDTFITGIAVGNEVFMTRDKTLVSHLLLAMQNLHLALHTLNLTNIIISSPMSLSILDTSSPPSSATFRYPTLMYPYLSFLANSSSPFMANVYPFFAYSDQPDAVTLNYSLFLPCDIPYVDPITNLTYSNMFDAQLDSIFFAISHLGFPNISILVSETGWPSKGDPEQSGASIDNARAYTNNLIEHVSSGIGTPLRPNIRIDTFIFALFNENMKPGPTSERNYGLFYPNMTPVYNNAFSKDLLSPGSSLIMTPSPSPLAFPQFPPNLNAREMCSSSSNTYVSFVFFTFPLFTWITLIHTISFIHDFVEQ